MFEHEASSQAGIASFMPGNTPGMFTIVNNGTIQTFASTPGGQFMEL